MTDAPARPFIAMFWMFGAIGSFTMMAVAGRTVQTEMNSFHLMAWRSLIGLVVVCALLAISRKGFSQIRTAHGRMHLTRNVFHFTGQNLWFYGIMAIPLSQLVALEFTVPLWVALMAPALLGEALTRAKVIAAGLGFAGVLIVAQPGVQAVGLGHAAGLGSALFFALSMIWTKRLMRFDGVLCVMFWMTLMHAIFGLTLGLATGFPWPSAGMWPWLLVVGLTGLLAHYSLTSALGYAPASVVAPMEFLRLPIITVVGMAVYAEALDPFVFLGAIVIFAGNWINIRGARPSALVSA